MKLRFRASSAKAAAGIRRPAETACSRIRLANRRSGAITVTRLLLPLPRPARSAVPSPAYPAPITTLCRCPDPLSSMVLVLIMSS